MGTWRDATPSPSRSRSPTPVARLVSPLMAAVQSALDKEKNVTGTKRASSEFCNVAKKAGPWP